MIYCEPLFGRGMGFGNCLFPWARCRIFSDLHKVRMIAPRWMRLRIGPLIRGGVDLRAYRHQILLAGLFDRPSDQIGPLGRLAIHQRAKRSPEPENLRSSPARSREDLLIEFRGDGNHFADLEGWSGFLRDELERLTRPVWLTVAERARGIPIGINVRIGNDFSAAKQKEDFFSRGGVKTPLNWFIENLGLIRAELGFAANAVVVSDGTSDQLAELLRLENVSFLRPGSAISDLLALSQTRILLASGASSFSAWASFLGQMPTISHPGQPLEWFRMTSTSRFLGVVDPASPSQEWIDELRRLRSEIPK